MDKSELSKIMVKIKDTRDEIAFSNLFDFLAPKLKSYFLQNGFSSEISEELLQEVMSIVWTKSDQYNPSKSAVSTWVYTIARNKKVDFWRKNSNISVKEEDIREFVYKDNYKDELVLIGLISTYSLIFDKWISSNDEDFSTIMKVADEYLNNAEEVGLNFRVI